MASNQLSSAEKVTSNQPSWSSLFGTNFTPNLKFHEPVVCEGRNVVEVSHEINNQGLSLWDDSLIGQFHGTSSHRAQIQAAVNYLWGHMGWVEVLGLENESFIFKFESKQTKNWLLDRGPWFIVQKPLFLKT